MGLLDPLHGDGYQLWSGAGGAVLVPVVWAILVYVTPTRCAQLGCRRKARGVSAAGAAFCSRHLPEVRDEGVVGTE